MVNPLEDRTQLSFKKHRYSVIHFSILYCLRFLRIGYLRKCGPQKRIPKPGIRSANLFGGTRQNSRSDTVSYLTCFRFEVWCTTLCATFTILGPFVRFGGPDYLVALRYPAKAGQLNGVGKVTSVQQNHIEGGMLPALHRVKRVVHLGSLLSDGVINKIGAFGSSRGLEVG